MSGIYDRKVVISDKVTHIELTRNHIPKLTCSPMGHAATD